MALPDWLQELNAADLYYEDLAAREVRTVVVEVDDDFGPLVVVVEDGDLPEDIGP